MDYRVILSRPALRDQGEIARAIAQDNPGIAERVGLELVQMAETLSTMPRRGGALQSRPGVHRLIRNPYLITYRIDETLPVVYVLRFWHAKRDPQSWFPA